MAEKPRSAAHKADHYHARLGETPTEPIDENLDDNLDDTTKDPTAQASADQQSTVTKPKDSSDENADEFKPPEEIAEDETTATEPTAPEDIAPTPGAVISDHKGGFWAWCKHHKVVVSIIAVVVVLAVLAGVPWTRYKIGGVFIKQTITVNVMDAQTHQAVTSAVVSAKNVTVKTDNKGQVHLRLPIGPAVLQVQKTYYQTGKATTTVPIMKPKKNVMINLRATGRQVPVTILNSLNGKPIENAVVTAENAEAKTDKNGHAIMVLSTSSKTATASVKATGYNTAATVTIQITTQTVSANTIRLTPAGMVYFLSNKSGKIDVVKTDLDGSNRQTVLAGTGSEDTQGTVLLASRDWKYLALLSKRDGGDYAKLFLIDTSTDKVTTMDEGQATFSSIGWHDHTFVYSVRRTTLQQWQPGFIALKSYNADTNALATLDQTQATGSDAYTNTYQDFSNFYITDSAIVYGVTWYYSSPSDTRATALAGKSNVIRTVTADGKTKKDVKTFDPLSTTYLEGESYDPQGVYFSVFNNVNDVYTIYKYEDNAVTATNLTEQQFETTAYNTYLYSPSGDNTLWSEQRDGKQSLLIGDKDAQNSKEIASGTDYSAYGWYTDDYILVTKNSSELYIMPVGGGQAIKISDYYKPNVNFRGYGYGYGGL